MKMIHKKKNIKKPFILILDTEIDECDSKDITINNLLGISMKVMPKGVQLKN